VSRLAVPVAVVKLDADDGVGPQGGRLSPQGIDSGVVVPHLLVHIDDAHDYLIARSFQVTQQLAIVAITNHGAGRNLDYQILAASPEAIGALAMLTAGRSPVIKTGCGGDSF
jgi:hypothetical protein